MAIQKISNAVIDTGAVTSDSIATGAVNAADISAGTITADKLHSTLDLSSNTLTLPTINHDITLNGVVTGDRFINASNSANPWLKGVDTGNNETFFVTQAGLGYFGNYLGIGTKTPNAPLEIKVPSSSGALTDAFQIRDSSNYVGIAMYAGAADGEIRVGAAGQLRGRYAAQYAGTRSAHSFTIGTNNTTAISIDDAQNTSVLISDSNTTQATLKGLVVSNSDGTTNNGSAISFAYGSNGNSFSKIGVINTDRTGGSEDQDIFFGNLTNGSYNETMRIRSSGNVGIGTNDPTSALHISKGSGATQLRMTRNNVAATGNDFARILFENSVGTTMASIRATSQSGNTECGIRFGAGGGDLERMRIDNGGRVLMPFQPAFLLKGAAGYGGGGQGQYTPPVNNSAIHNFSSTEMDVGGNVSSNTRFTAPVAGNYYIGFEPNFGNNSAGTETRYMSAAIVKNGTTYASHLQAVIEVTDGWGSSNSYWHMSVNTIVYLQAQEYIEFRVSRSSSSDYNGIIYSDATYAYGYLIG